MEQRLISVIIPTYNEEKNICGLLDCLSGIPGLEVVVSDGGSNDETKLLCSQYPVKLIEAPLGRGSQLNAGAQVSDGEILFFLHADSRVKPVVFDDIREAVNSGHRWGCCTIEFDESSLFFSALTLGSRLRARLFSRCYGDQGIYCERDLFFMAGGFPPIPIMEDIGLSRRLRYYSPAHVVPGKVITSSRRFKKGGPLRTLIRMQIIKLLYAAGVPAERLSRIYRPNGGRQT